MKNLITVLFILLVGIAHAQINDDWSAVKVGDVDMAKMYVGETLVWEKTGAPIEYISKGTLTELTGDGTLNINMPANTQSGDLLILSLIHESDGGTWSLPVPTGWTILSSMDYSASHPRVHYKIASDNESNTSIDVIAKNTSAVVYQFRNNKTTTAPYFDRATSISQYINNSGDRTSTAIGQVGVILYQSYASISGTYTGDGWIRLNDRSTNALSHNLYYYPFSAIEESEMLIAPGYSTIHGKTQFVIDIK